MDLPVPESGRLLARRALLLRAARAFSPLLALLVLVWPSAAMPQAAGPAESDAIRALIGSGSIPELRRRDFKDLRQPLDDSYRPRGYAPLWLAPAQAHAVVAELEDAANLGLDPGDYDVAWLQSEVNAIAAGDRSPQRVARADVALTVSLFRLLSDLHRGRVAPERAGFKFSVDKPLDLGALLRDGMASGDWHAVVVAVEPSFPLYRRLKAELARARVLAATPLPPVPPLPAGKSKIAPGDTYAGVAALDARLRLIGDLPASAPAPVGDRYEGAVVDAVRSYQERHGLKADGVLGKDTLTQLSVPLQQRVRQFELSLERLRWLPQLPAGPLIAVNIPSFRLWAFANAGADAAAQLTMPVIVGAAAKARETPVFIGEMRYIEFSPYWNVTPSIQRSEIVPHLQRDASYWQREDLEAVPVSGTGDPITAFDANTLAGLKSGALRVRQRPGPKNALGPIKFVLPNTMNIYLHSTPAQQLFSETRRDFSHGCIRLSDPTALAEFVLRDQPAWTPERIKDAMAAGKLSTATLTRPIPVVLFYTTAIVDAKGRALFSDDIYGHDRGLEQALRNR